MMQSLLVSAKAEAGSIQTRLGYSACLPATCGSVLRVGLKQFVAPTSRCGNQNRVGPQHQPVNIGARTRGWLDWARL